MAPPPSTKPGAKPVYDREGLLSAHFLLKHLPKEDLHRLATYASVTHHPAHAVIFQKGDAGDSLMAVVAGRVKISCHSLEGKELVLNIIGAGDLFGEIALIDGEPRTADAVALEPTDLLVLRRRDFLPYLDRNPQVGLKLLTTLCRRLRHTSAQLEDSLFLEVPSRLGRSLLRLADTFGEDVPDGVRLTLKLSQQQLAGLVGVTRESVNKQLGEWQRLGLIAHDAGRLVLRDIDALEALCGGEAAEEE